MLTRTAAAVTLAATLTACSTADTSTTDESPSPSGLEVVASLYSAQFLAERIGGQYVTVQPLTAGGADPHDLELTPQQVGEVQDADAVLYISQFQAAVDEAVTQAQGEVVDLSEGLTLRESDEHAREAEGEQAHVTDPHIWLDPVLMAKMATTVANSLGDADPQHRAQFQANADKLRSELAELDQTYQAGTADCAIRTMVVSHEAFGYLADQYGFQQKGISGLSPENEPSAAAVAELVDFVRDTGVSTVYTEVAVDPSVAQTIAAEAGAQTATLNPLGAAPEQGDYLTVMRENLDTLRAGQSCA